MKNGIARIYLQEIERQCHYALELISQLNTRLNANNLAPQPIIRILDVFLGDVSRVSLLLWPERRGDQSRGHFLRKLLNVSDSNPLKDRKVRNAFQHMDERLDQWAKGPKSTCISDFSTLPRGMISGSDSDPRSLIGTQNMLRHYVPNEKVLIHFGDEISIEILVGALEQLRNTVQATLPTLPPE